MDLLSAIPGVSELIGKFVTSPTEKAQLESKLRELDIREIEALSHVQSSWLSNNSMFVSGAIPSMLWVLVLVILFNFILTPLLGAFGIVVPILDLPEWYSSMCSTIILGLFAKKAWDGTDLTAGSFSKKSKYELEAISNSQSWNVTPTKREEVAEQQVIEKQTVSQPVVKETPKPVTITTPKPTVTTKPKTSTTQLTTPQQTAPAKKPVKDMTKEEVDERYQQLLREKGIIKEESSEESE